MHMLHVIIDLRSGKNVTEAQMRRPKESITDQTLILNVDQSSTP